MIEPFLRSQMEPVIRRYRRLLRRRGLAICWGVGALVGFAFLLLYRLTGWSSALTFPILGIAIGAATLLTWRRTQRWEPDFHQIARQIEETHPDLRALVVTAVEQHPDPATGKLGYLQERVIREAIIESFKHDWVDTVSDRRLWGMQGVQLAALVLLLLALGRLHLSAPGGAASLEAARRVTVTPGDASIEKGNGLAVLARFAGRLPAEVTLVVRPESQESRHIQLFKTLDDPVFGGSLPEVTSDLTYHIEYGGQQTREYKIKVFEHPRLERADAQLTFPEYTGLPMKKIEDTRRLTAVEGSLLDLSIQLNKPVRSAKLLARDKSVVPLLTYTNNAAVSLEKFQLTTGKTYELQLVDLEGRTNKIPANFVIDVLKNRTPELKIASPRGDQRVSPLEEITFQGEAWDDFGLRAYGLTYTAAGSEPKSITLGESAGANEKRQFGYLLKLEELSAQPDQLISYFVWADDIGPDNQVRRTSSDMYFAEVRPFEEIFREAQSAEGESAQQQQPSRTEKLAELQKQIINATWKLQRQEGKTPSPQYLKDAPVVQQSQKQALEQAQALKEGASDANSKLLIESVEKEMERAVKHLAEATKATAPLPAALAAEQAAYQALLKLAAHEYRVSRGQKGARGASAQNAQRQLDQLELKQSENRYETQRQASPQQNAEQREQLQVLNRLKELAQRQQDLNERLKELQTALQEAKTEQEREDIRRRLKRLREEEQQMLADIDELGQRMAQPQNQARMAEARKELEQTRSEVQRAAEALEKESVPQALTSGTRAQRELQQLRDDFRKKNSNQFAEEMRQMRSDARELAQKEAEIGKQIESASQNKRKTLSDPAETKGVSEQLAQQKEKMTNLLEQVTQVSQQSETSEPLLSKQLYDTLRKTSQANVDNSLSMASELLKRNFVNEAGQFEQRARKDIEDLKQGVEHAAESVLGDDTEALRMAKRELDDLARQVDQEIARANTNAAQQAGARSIQQSPGEQTAGRGNDPSKAATGQASNGAQPNQNGQQSASGGGKEQADPTAQARGNQGQPGQNASQSGGKRDPSAQGDRQQPASPGGGEQNAQNQQARGNQGQPGQQGQQGQNGQPGGGAQQNQPGQAQGQGGQRAQGQPGQGQGAAAAGQNGQPAQRGSGAGGQPAEGEPANQPGARQQVAQGQRTGNGQAQRNPAGGNNGGGNRETQGNFFEQGAGQAEPSGPITGRDYAAWSDRLRDVEELLDQPELRNEVANIRERARAMRVEFKRHSKEPQWPLVQTQIASRLVEVRNRISEELARRESNDSLVPIDRDPVPGKFSDLVRRYYEKLGSNE